LRGQGSDLKKALLYARSVLRNRSLVLVLSDFLVPTFDNELRMMAKRHEVILLHCYSDAERGSRLKGIYEVCDPETGGFYLLDGNSRKTRDVLLTTQLELQNKLSELATQNRADFLSLSMDDDYLQRLVLFFRQRGPSRL
jgi:uncharacterized protein (DUF58 family)